MNVQNPRRGGRRPAGAEFHDALAEAIAARGVSLEGLRRQLADRGAPVSLATLSYWRSGRSQPERPRSLDAVAELEDLLGLPPGDLSTRLGPSRRPGPPTAVAAVPEVVADHASLVLTALEDLGLDGGPELADETLHVTVDVDRDGQPRTVVVNGIWRALVDGAQRIPLVYVNDGPIARPPEITVSGGRLGRDRSLPERGLVAHEFVLERPLRVGEEAVLEQRTRWLDDVLDQSYEHYLVRRVRELALWVRFHPDKVPTSARTFTVADGDHTEHALDLEGVTSVHHVLRGFGPGSAGVAWTW